MVKAKLKLLPCPRIMFFISGLGGQLHADCFTTKEMALVPHG